jgi:hypothetical protein
MKKRRKGRKRKKKKETMAVPSIKGVSFKIDGLN